MYHREKMILKPVTVGITKFEGYFIKGLKNGPYISIEKNRV